MNQIRPLTDEESCHVGFVVDSFAKLPIARILSSSYGTFRGNRELDLEALAFMFYEGLDVKTLQLHGELIKEVTVFTVMGRLVGTHGFQWAMAGGVEHFEYAVIHPSLDAPVTFSDLLGGLWYFTRHDGESPERNSPWYDKVINSYTNIVEYVEGNGSAR